MAFTTAEQWRQMRARERARRGEIDELVRAFFANQFVGGPEGLAPGMPAVTSRPLTAQERNQIFQRVSVLCNEQSADYLLAVAP